MRVSIIVPSFNQARFIRQTLDSILSQDHPDIEVLVFDGGSTDGTFEILENYRERIPYVSRIDHGQADAINQGLLKCTGEVMAYLNSDDIYYPGTINTIVKYFEANPATMALYGDAWHLREDGSVIERYYTEPWSYPRLLEVCYLCQPTVFWRREVVRRHGLLDEKLHIALDYEYWLRVGRHTSFDYLQGSYLAGSRMYEQNKTLANKVRSHEEYLLTVMRYSNQPPYGWLMHLAHHSIDADAAATGLDLKGRERSIAFVESVLKLADKFKISLDECFLDRLESML